jgi:hypothetical protein
MNTHPHPGKEARRPGEHPQRPVRPAADHPSRARADHPRS